jgi:phospholipase A1/A2
MKKNTLLGIAILNLVVVTSYGQGVSRDSLTALIDQSPAFTIFQDNYFLTGLPLNERATKSNSDIKYQISFKHRLTNAELPLDSYLFLTYTQKSFWEVYRNSSPFAESNYNPGIGLGKFFYNGDSFVGAGSVMVQHESNGQNELASRSWNRISVNYFFPVAPQATLALTGWIPFGLDDNPDLMDYIGYGEAALNWQVMPNKLIVDAIGRKGYGWDWKGSLQTQVSFRLTENRNQYLMLQWFTGYAESLINYQEYNNMLRLGIVIKPSNGFVN